MNLTVEEVVNIIEEIFSGSKVRALDNVYEKPEGSFDYLKLVLAIHQLNYKKLSLLHTKFMFKTDIHKVMLLENSFSYLYDMNCQYKMLNFKNTEDLKKKIEFILDNEKFGKNILALSKFMQAPASTINEYYRSKKITNLSIFNVKYDPKVNIVPCEAQSFDFEFDVNNSNIVKLNIKKDRVNSFEYIFNIDEKYIKVDAHDLSDLIPTIAETIKNNI